MYPLPNNTLVLLDWGHVFLWWEKFMTSGACDRKNYTDVQLDQMQINILKLLFCSNTRFCQFFKPINRLSFSDGHFFKLENIPGQKESTLVTSPRHKKKNIAQTVLGVIFEVAVIIWRHDVSFMTSDIVAFSETLLQ